MENTNSVLNEKLEQFCKKTETNLHEIQNPSPGNTDCGSERIQQAIIDITFDAFMIALSESKIKEDGRQYHCDVDLLSEAIGKLYEKMINKTK